jgi:quercetin 2,3-dioxygenase
VKLHADVHLYAGIFGAGERAELPLAQERHAWIHVAKGAVRVNGQELAAGDGAAISGEAAVTVEGTTGGEVLVFDLA